MKDPQVIETIREGATYSIPSYQVTNEGLKDGETFEILLCKGNKDDESAFRQTGFFTETLLATAVQYLKDVNKGELASRETSEAITCIETGLLWLGKRAADRKRREVQGTYQK